MTNQTPTTETWQTLKGVAVGDLVAQPAVPGKPKTGPGPFHAIVGLSISGHGRDVTLDNGETWSGGTSTKYFVRKAGTAESTTAKAERHQAKAVRDADRKAQLAEETKITPIRQTTLRVLDPNQAGGNWMEVHKDGCADLTKGRRGQPKGQGSWTLTASTLTEAAETIASDFIGEGSMTVEEAVDHITWAPCVHLPRDAKSTTKTTKSTRAVKPPVDAKTGRQASVVAIERAKAQRMEEGKDLDRLGAALANAVAKDDPKAQDKAMLALRDAGASYSQIAAWMGVVPMTARTRVLKAQANR